MEYHYTVPPSSESAHRLLLVRGRPSEGLRPDAKGRRTSIQPGVHPYDRLIAYELKGRHVIIGLFEIR
jgi:hypothetical protein